MLGELTIAATNGEMDNICESSCKTVSNTLNYVMDVTERVAEGGQRLIIEIIFYMQKRLAFSSSFIFASLGST